MNAHNHPVAAGSQSIKADTLRLSAEIVAAYVAQNTVAPSAVSSLIG